MALLIGNDRLAANGQCRNNSILQNQLFTYSRTLLYVDLFLDLIFLVYSHLLLAMTTLTSSLHVGIIIIATPVLLSLITATELSLFKAFNLLQAGTPILGIFSCPHPHFDRLCGLNDRADSWAILGTPVNLYTNFTVSRGNWFCNTVPGSGYCGAIAVTSYGILFLDLSGVEQLILTALRAWDVCSCSIQTFQLKTRFLVFQFWREKHTGKTDSF